jgi:hypothetical protein
LTAIRPVHRFDLIPQPLDGIERRRLISFLSGSATCSPLIGWLLAHGSLRLLQLLLQALQPLGNLSFGAI